MCTSYKYLRWRVLHQLSTTKTIFTNLSILDDCGYPGYASTMLLVRRTYILFLQVLKWNKLKF